MNCCDQNERKKHFPYQELWEKYQDALETIAYQQFRIRELNEEVDAWCQAYEEIIDEAEFNK